MSSSSAPLSTPEGSGSVSGAPNLPEGLTDTFTSRYIDTGELRLHAVAPEELLAALTEFLAPYREGGGGGGLR
jgi:hypothetical protein